MHLSVWKCILVMPSFVDPTRIGLLGRCLELHSLICVVECLEMHSCSAELCRSCAHWELCRVVGARGLELHSLICAFESLEMHSCSVWKCNACLVLNIP